MSYENVRRTTIMIEESIKEAAKAYVFEPNTVNTWVAVKDVICNYLTALWKEGELKGTALEDAFSVSVELGEADNIMRIVVEVAIVKPTEKIEIMYEQEQQNDN